MAVPSTPPPDAQPDAPGKNTPLPSTTNGDTSIQKPSDGPPPQSSTVPVPKTSLDDGLAPPSSSPSGNVLLDPLPRASLSDRQNIVDGDKPDPEDASTSHTLTPNKPTSSSAARKANASSISDAATTAQPNGSHSKNQPSSVHSSKPTFFSKLFRALIPCVTPSKSHDIELDLPSSKPQPPASSSNEKAPHDAKNDPNVAVSKGASASSPSQLVSSAEPLDTTGLAPIPISVTPPPTLPADADVVLPPTPTTKLLPESETEGVTSGAVQPPGSTGGSSLHEKPHSRDSTAPSRASLDAEDSEGTSFTEDEDIDDVNGIDDLEDEEEKLILNGGAGIPIGPDGIPKPLLPPISPQHAGRKCLVLDLDETLVHSSFKSIQQADYVVPVEIEYHWHNVYVIKRPGVDNFLKKMGEIYEVVVFTASLSKYADPVLDKLDIHQVVSHRLFRESCYNHKGNYVKDLSQLGRPIADTIILDNSPASYIFHPNNAVPVSSWFNDPHDTELTDLVPFLTDLSTVDDVRGVLDGAR